MKDFSQFLGFLSINCKKLCQPVLFECYLLICLRPALRIEAGLSDSHTLDHNNINPWIQVWFLKYLHAIEINKYNLCLCGWISGGCWEPIQVILDIMQVNVLSALWNDYPISLARYGFTQAKVYSLAEWMTLSGGYPKAPLSQILWVENIALDILEKVLFSVNCAHAQMFTDLFTICQSY